MEHEFWNGFGDWISSDQVQFCTGFDWFQTLFSYRNIKLSRCMWLKYGHTIGLSPYELLIIFRMFRLQPKTFHCLSSRFRTVAKHNNIRTCNTIFSTILLHVRYVV